MFAILAHVTEGSAIKNKKKRLDFDHRVYFRNEYVKGVGSCEKLARVCCSLTVHCLHKLLTYMCICISRQREKKKLSGFYTSFHLKTNLGLYPDYSCVFFLY